MDVPYWTEGALERIAYEDEVTAKLHARFARLQHALVVLLDRCKQYTG